MSRHQEYSHDGVAMLRKSGVPAHSQMRSFSGSRDGTEPNHYSIKRHGPASLAGPFFFAEI
jgi:hypothetical protein